MEGYAGLCNFDRTGKNWRVYEDLRARDGAIVFLSGQNTKRVRARSRVTVNGGPRSDTVEISPGQEKRFDIWAQYD